MKNEVAAERIGEALIQSIGQGPAYLFFAGFFFAASFAFFPARAFLANIAS
jgi:hypothetical protein